MATALQFFQHLPGVAAIAQSGVITDLSGADIQNLQNFVHHDGDMGPGGRFAALDDLLHVGLVFFRV